MFQLPFTEAWHNTTTLHPLAIALTVVLSVALFILPRRYALLPLLLAACFISPAQRIVLLTMDFTMLRLLLLVGCARIALRGELIRLHWRTLDTLFVGWCIAGLVTYGVQFGSMDMFVHRLGSRYDAIGLYFLVRYLIRDWNDLVTLTTSVIVMSVPVTASLLFERATGRNVFSIFGGVPEYTMVRAGRLRVQGAFGHPILLGCFWAALFPLIVALIRVPSWRRWLVPVGVVTSVTAVLVTASSTPWLVLFIACASMALYPVRRWMPWIRWSGVLGLIAIHLVMLKPIWHLIARADVVTGSTGWYRYKLVDEFFAHFNDWWLIGTHNYMNWYTYGFEAVTNQYVLEGVNGGLVTLLFFVGVIVEAYRAIGQLLRRVHENAMQSAFAWAIGVSLTVHVVSFIGVAYTGQVHLLWFLVLAMAATFQPLVQRSGMPYVLRLRADKVSVTTDCAGNAEPTVVPAS
ncbi:MAG: hypothetical protein KC983_06155 [Phycisphaerales bacterium]|nr:hypothetical protein [Phycisphaerales bacterium]